MKQTENIGLNILEDDDFVDDQTINENMEKLDAEIASIKTTDEITEEDLYQWYNEDTGIVNYEIERMYKEDIVYEEDTGIPNIEIEDMYKE